MYSNPNQDFLTPQVEADQRFLLFMTNKRCLERTSDYFLASNTAMVTWYIQKLALIKLCRKTHHLQLYTFY